MSRLCQNIFVAFVAFVFAVPVLAQSAVKQNQPIALAPTQSNNDLAFDAYQRGFYMTAFTEASKRAQANDAAAMTLLGELYAQGLGVGRDERKAMEWYQHAADRGDANAMFALAMFNFEGRGGARNPSEGARLLSEAAKHGHVLASYDLGLFYFQGKQVNQDFTQAAELFAAAAAAGNPEAQYALATMYKEGRGVAKDARKAMSLMSAASLGGNVDAMVEYAIGAFNGNGGIHKNENAAAQLFLKASQRGNSIAQNRLARVLMAGHGMAANPTEAVKWHIIAKASGASDHDLDVFTSKQTEEVRASAENAAKKWMSTIPAAHR